MQELSEYLDMLGYGTLGAGLERTALRSLHIETHSSLPEAALCECGPQRISRKEEGKNDLFPQRLLKGLRKAVPTAGRRDIPTTTHPSSKCPGCSVLDVSIKE